MIKERITPTLNSEWLLQNPYLSETCVMHPDNADQMCGGTVPRPLSGEFPEEENFTNFSDLIENDGQGLTSDNSIFPLNTHTNLFNEHAMDFTPSSPCGNRVRHESSCSSWAPSPYGALDASDVAYSPQDSPLPIASVKPLPSRQTSLSIAMEVLGDSSLPFQNYENIIDDDLTKEDLPSTRLRTMSGFEASNWSKSEETISRTRYHSTPSSGQEVAPMAPLVLPPPYFQINQAYQPDQSVTPLINPPAYQPPRLQSLPSIVEEAIAEAKPIEENDVYVQGLLDDFMEATSELEMVDRKNEVIVIQEDHCYSSPPPIVTEATGKSPSLINTSAAKVSPLPISPVAKVLPVGPVTQVKTTVNPGLGKTGLKVKFASKKLFPTRNSTRIPIKSSSIVEEVVDLTDQSTSRTSQSTTPTSPPPVSRKRDRNNAACRESRMKKKLKLQGAESDAVRLAKDNEEQRKKIAKLEVEVKETRALLLSRMTGKTIQP